MILNSEYCIHSRVKVIFFYNCAGAAHLGDGNHFFRLIQCVLYRIFYLCRKVVAEALVEFRDGQSQEVDEPGICFFIVGYGRS